MRRQNSSSIRIPHGCLFYLNIFHRKKLCVHKYHSGRMVDMAKWHIFSSLTVASSSPRAFLPSTFVFAVHDFPMQALRASALKPYFLFLLNEFRYNLETTKRERKQDAKTQGIWLEWKA